MLLFLTTVFSLCCVIASGQLSNFEVPDATVEALFPRGLRVSIPDQEGIKLFAFHAKINEEMNGREGGFFSRDILKAKNGRWTFYDPSARLKVGDTLYYWTYVDYFDGRNKLGYTKDDQSFVVKELIGEPPATLAPPAIDIRQPEPNSSSECNPSETIVEGKTVCKGKIIFEDNFDNLNQWTPEIRFAQEPDYEFVLYNNRPETLNVRDGKLKISPQLTEDLYGKGVVTSQKGLDLGSSCTGTPGSLECAQKPSAFLIIPPVTSSLITTKQKFAFKYGKIEVLAKLPKGDWIYPELFLNPKNEIYGPFYESGQMRIAFLPGNDATSNVLYGGGILGSSTAARYYGLRKVTSSTSWGGEFHKFWLVWKKYSITVGVDDTTYGTIFPPNNGFASEQSNLDLKNADRWRSGTSLAPFDDYVYLTVGVGVGGHSFEDRQDGSKPWKNSDPKSQRNFFKAQFQWKPTWGSSAALEVDHVKVWAL